VNAQLLLLDGPTVARWLRPDDVLDAVREAFTLHSRRQGRVFPVIREALDTGGIFGIKAGDVQAEGLLGFKAAGFWPSNRAVGGEPHQATIVLVDPATGRPLCILDGNAITTARTAAAGALALSALASKDSTQLCVFGTGVQARAQTEYALRALPGIACMRYISSSRQPDRQFEEMFAGRAEVRCASDANDAVSRSDVVITATPGRAVLFDASAVQAGTHVNAIGADTRGKRELPAGLLERASLFVDDRDQARQIGEAQWAPEAPCTELGDVLTGAAPFTRTPEAVTVCDLTGLALQDLTVARRVAKLACADAADIAAVAGGAGVRVPWPW
jgi:ornithine cyclodeaminase